MASLHCSSCLAPKISRVKLETLSGCKLGVSWYPDFRYNAQGGNGYGKAQQLEDGKISVQFDTPSLVIPALDCFTTRFLVLPLPPPLRIDIKPEALRGFIDQRDGQVELSFSAEFVLTAGSLYTAPSLLVNTILTTESCKGKRRSAQGERLDESGRCKLVGIAPLSRVNDTFLDTFLRLPSECLAVTC